MMNKKALQLYRAKNETSVKGKHVLDFFLFEEHEVISQNVRNLLEQSIITNYEQTLLRMDGTSFSAELSAAVVGDDNNNPKYFLTVIRDISQRKKKIPFSQNKTNWKVMYFISTSDKSGNFNENAFQIDPRQAEKDQILYIPQKGLYYPIEVILNTILIITF